MSILPTSLPNFAYPEKINKNFLGNIYISISPICPEPRIFNNKSTSTCWLPVLSHVQPLKIRRQHKLVREYDKISSNPSVPVHEDSSSVTFTRLKSRSPFIDTAQQLSGGGFDTATAWGTQWHSQAPIEWQAIFDSNKSSDGFDLPRKTWSILNRIKANHGRCVSASHKWGLKQTPECYCGAKKQTIDHVTFECPHRAFTSGHDHFIGVSSEAKLWMSSLDKELLHLYVVLIVRLHPTRLF